MKIIVIDVTCKYIRCIPVIYSPNHLTDLYHASMKEKGKEIEKNFTDSNGLNPNYNDVDFFRGPGENTVYLMNDENTAIK